VVWKCQTHFLPTAGPTAAFYGGEWPGDDLYTSDRRFQIMVDNCRAFAAGRALRNVVDKSSWF